MYQEQTLDAATRPSLRGRAIATIDALNTPATTPKRDDLIFDVGMHKGADTDYYLKKGFRVIGFEAVPDLVDHCRLRFSDAVDSGRLTIVEGAIVGSHHLAARKPTVRFYRNLDSSVWGTVSESWAARNAMLGTRSETIEVRTIDFADCLVRHGIPRYMKIDIEGSDMLCLEALLEFEAKPDYVSIEAETREFAKLAEEVALLERLGYTNFKLVDQSTISTRQVQPNPPKEGIYAPGHLFTYECSGLFGRELPGEWKDSKGVLAAYRRIFLLYRLFGNYSVLQRWRLGRRALRRASKILRRPYVVGWYDTHARHSSVLD
jgi:FkbM family methyltransferase